MEILLDVIVAGLVAGGVAGGIVLAGRTRGPRHAPAGAAAVPMPAHPLGGERTLGDAPAEAGAGPAGSAAGQERAAPQLAVASDPDARSAVREEINAELRERRAEIARIEERLITKEEAVEVRLAEAERRERSL